MRLALLILGTLLPLAPVFGKDAPRRPVAGKGAEAVQWVNLEDGLRKSAEAGGHVFVMVYTDWCGYCRKLSATSLRDQAVAAELGKNFQSVRLNAESERMLTWKGERISARDLAGKTWGVEGYPTLLFLNKNGDIVGSFSSYAEADLLLNLLQYVSSGARERNESFQNYLLRRKG